MTLPPPEVCKDICPPAAQYTWECSIENPEVEITYDEYKLQNNLKLKCLQSFRYPPPLYQGEYPKFREISRRKREVQNESYTEDDIYNIDYIEDDIYSIDFSIKITVEGLVSLALVQLPGIALGILGIIKAF